jgi:alpha-D-xyloside xylohydrolase
MTGLPAMQPQWAAGFWQSKLRYKTQSELSGVVREYGRRGLPLSAVVIDGFQWTRFGEWRFDAEEWPDPQAIVDELHGTCTEMDDRALLVENARGLPLHVAFWDKGTDEKSFLRLYDPTHPEARRLYIVEGPGRLLSVRDRSVLVGRL